MHYYVQTIQTILAVNTRVAETTGKRPQIRIHYSGTIYRADRLESVQSGSEQRRMIAVR